MMGTPLILPIEATEKRKWAIFHEEGDFFAEDEDYDGFVLSIEVSHAEALAILRTLGLSIGHPAAIDSDLMDEFMDRGPQ